MALHEFKTTLESINNQVIEKLVTEKKIDSSTAHEITIALKTMKSEYEKLETRYSRCEKMVRTDEKTSLLKHNPHVLTDVIKQASRYTNATDHITFPVSMVRFDIDDFSRINNLHGHDAGDIVLWELAQMFKKNSRPTDKLIRFGGEEFDVLLPATDEHGTREYLEKIYDDMADFYVDYKGTSIPVTVSAGFTSKTCLIFLNDKIDDNYYDECFQKLQRQADDALYEAKMLGKKQFTQYREGMDSYYSTCRKNYTRC